MPRGGLTALGPSLSPWHISLHGLLVRGHGGSDFLQQRPLLDRGGTGILSSRPGFFRCPPGDLGGDPGVLGLGSQDFRLPATPFGSAPSVLRIGAFVLGLLARTLRGGTEFLGKGPLLLGPLPFVLGGDAVGLDLTRRTIGSPSAFASSLAHEPPFEFDAWASTYGCILRVRQHA